MGSRLKMVVLCNLAVVVRCALMIWLLYTTRARWTSDISERQGPSHKLGSHHFVHWERLTTVFKTVVKRFKTFNNSQRIIREKTKLPSSSQIPGLRLATILFNLVCESWLSTQITLPKRWTIGTFDVSKKICTRTRDATFWNIGCSACASDVLNRRWAQIMLWSTILQI